MGPIEYGVRLVAAWRGRRWARLRQRRAEERAAVARRRAALLVYEVAHAEERLRLARTLIRLAKEFSQSDAGRWARATYGRWPVAGGLEVDGHGRLWRHIVLKFTNPRITPMDAAEDLAASFTTAALRAAIGRVEPQSFWGQALQEELLFALGFNGSPV